MRRVYKWDFPDTNGEMKIPWTPGDRVVLVAEQNAALPLPTVWVEHHIPHSEDQALLRVYGTGHLIENDYHEHVGSAVMSTRPLVWHVYLEYPIYHYAVTEETVASVSSVDPLLPKV